MSDLVALATGILAITGRVVLALALAGFFSAYLALGLVLTPLVLVAVALPRLPTRLRALGRLVRRWSMRRVVDALLGQRPFAGR